MPKFLLMFILLLSNYLFSMELKQNTNSIANQFDIPDVLKPLEDFISRKLALKHWLSLYYTEKAYWRFLVQTFKKDIETAEHSTYDPICYIKWEPGNIAGTGVLISHPKDPKKLAILTAAHVVVNKKGTCFVTFKDWIARKMVGKPILLDEKWESDGIDLALITLESYPDIEPAKRCYNKLALGENMFAHIAGCGNFYDNIDGKKFGITLYKPGFRKHAIAGLYQVSNSTTEQYKALLNDYKEYQKILKDNDENSNLNLIKKIDRHQCLLSLHSESRAVTEPKTIFTCAPLTKGFSGSPLFNAKDEIIAISSNGVTTSVKFNINWQPLIDSYRRVSPNWQENLEWNLDTLNSIIYPALEEMVTVNSDVAIDIDSPQKEIIKNDYQSLTPFTVLYPGLKRLTNFCNNISCCTKEYIFGERSNITILFSSLVIGLLFAIYDDVESNPGVILSRIIFCFYVGKIIDRIGNTLSRFQDETGKYCPFEVVKSGVNYSIAMPIGSCNEVIDDFLTKLGPVESGTRIRSTQVAGF